LVSRKYEDLAQVRADSIALGVTHCISQGTSADDWEPQLRIARSMPDFVSSCLAVHPSEVTEVSDEQLAYMEELCHQYPQAAIGETGLDYFWPAPEGWSEDAYRARQRVFLERHFQLAQSLGLNISLHTRDKKGLASFEDAFAIARNFPKVRPVFHCFIGNREQAERIFSELDGLISFTGLLTFNKTEDIQAVAAWCPSDCFMVETDSPFLSPTPFRGITNIPGRTKYVVDKIAELRHVTPEEIAACTTENAKRFFRLSL
jgi:TatD DNase family protein